MKKAVSILVSAISLIAIIFVAIFGTKPQGIVPRIYIESLTIKPLDMSSYVEDEKNGNYCTIKYDEDSEVRDDENVYMPYIFTTEVLPKNATDQSFAYSIADNYKEYMDFPSNNPLANRRGIFLIKKRTDKKAALVRINVRPVDGGNGKGDSLKVIIDYRAIKN